MVLLNTRIFSIEKSDYHHQKRTDQEANVCLKLLTRPYLTLVHRSF